MRHAGQENVVGEPRLTCNFRSAVYPAARNADDSQAFAIRLGTHRLCRFLCLFLVRHLASQITSNNGPLRISAILSFLPRS